VFNIEHKVSAAEHVQILVSRFDWSILCKPCT